MNLQININTQRELTPKEVLDFQSSFTKLANTIFDLEYGEMKIIIRERKPQITQYPMKSLRLDG